MVTITTVKKLKIQIGINRLDAPSILYWLVNRLPFKTSVANGPYISGMTSGNVIVGPIYMKMLHLFI